VQLRIYDTDKLAADNLAACATYEHPSDEEMEHEEANHAGSTGHDPTRAQTPPQQGSICCPPHPPGKKDVVLIQELWIVGNNTSNFTPRVMVKPGPAFLLRHTLTLILFHSLAKATSPRSDWS